MEDILLVAPMECHARYLTTPNPNLPEHLASVARAFIEPARALAHHDLEMFERLTAPDRAMECPPDIPLADVLNGLPSNVMRGRALEKTAQTAFAARAGMWTEAVHCLIEAKDAAVRSLV